MKKSSLLLAAILGTTSAFGAQNSNYTNTIKGQVKNFCIEMFEEQGGVKDVAGMKKYCGEVAKCVVTSAPNTYALQDTNYMQVFFLQCLANEARKLGY